MNVLPIIRPWRRHSRGRKPRRWPVGAHGALMTGGAMLAFALTLIWSPARAAENPPRSPESWTAHQWLQNLQAGQLSPAQVEVGARLALQAQANDAVEWDQDWGDLVQLARQKHLLADGLWGDYLLGAVQFRIRVAASAPRGGSLTYWAEAPRARVGHKDPVGSVFAERVEDISGVSRSAPGQAPLRERMNLSATRGFGSSGKVDLGETRFAQLPLGPQTFHYRLSLRAVEGRDEPAEGASGVWTRVVDKTLPWQLVEANGQPVPPALRADPALREGLLGGFHHITLLRDTTDPTLVEIRIQVDRPLTDMAFEMSLRVGQDVYPLGPVAWVKGQGQPWAFNADLPESVRELEVILTPSPRAASRLARDSYHRVMDIRSIWDGPPLVLPSAFTYQPQPLEMVHIFDAPEEVAREFLLDQLPADSPLAQAIEQGGAVRPENFKETQRELAPDAATAFRAGCVLMAAGDFPGAMARFVQARQMNPDAALERLIQRPQRKLCGLWLAAAKKKDPQAMATLAAAYEHGWGVKANIQQTKRWYRNGANAGHAESMCRLAFLYERKMGAEVHTEAADAWYAAQAAEWYSKAANLGNAEAKLRVQNHH